MKCLWSLKWSNQVLQTAVLLLVLMNSKVESGNPDAKRLYDDLLSNYNKLVRPVANISETVTVHLKLKLSQLIAVNLKNQIMTTNLWVEQFWRDYKLEWDPSEYGGVKSLHVPADHIWRPDIVLYNNADGNFEVTLATKATLHYTGDVAWKPPAIYHSSCEMDVEYFPFDEQTCVMKFGSWTYDGFQVDLRHEEEIHSPSSAMYNAEENSPTVDVGIDLTEFYMSVEWDILEVPAQRNVKFYTCCDEPYLDITFNITMRRKTLFYTVNLIIPCMGISFLTILVFYLPSDSGEKVSLSISILLSLTVFFLLLAEIIPPTSLVVPLLGKFVLFTMILDTFSICVTVVVLNIHFRSPETHTMTPWIRRVFIHILPRLLSMKRPVYDRDRHRCPHVKNSGFSFTRGLNNYYEAEDTGDLMNAAVNMAYDLTQHTQCQYSNHNQIRYQTGHNGKVEHGIRNEALGETELCYHSQEYLNSNQIDSKYNSYRVSMTPNLSRRHLGNSVGFVDIPEIPPRPKSAISNLSLKDFKDFSKINGDTYSLNGSCKIHGNSKDNINLNHKKSVPSERSGCKPGHLCPEIYKALDGILFIAETKKSQEEKMRIIEDWKYVAQVLDRLFLWIFTIAVLVGTAGIIFQAPTLYDDREPIDYQLSEIGLATARPMAAAWEAQI